MLIIIIFHCKYFKVKSRIFYRRLIRYINDNESLVEIKRCEQIVLQLLNNIN